MTDRTSVGLQVIAVVAVAENRCIGIDNQLPWHLPEDLKRFKALTLDKPVLMGRKTYESILAQLGKPLPRRTHLVLTRQPDWQPEPAHAEQVRRIGSLNEGMALAHELGAAELMLVGGAEVYAQALSQDLVDAIELTEVGLQVAGDAFFPELSAEQWSGTLVSAHPAQGDLPGYRFVRLERRRD